MTTGSLFYTTYRFYVEITGITEGGFDECSGLTSEVDVLPWPEGGLNDYVHLLPGRVKQQSHVTLKRGIATPVLWQWFYDVTQGKIERKSLSIIVTGYQQMSSLRWDFAAALPVKWTGPELKAAANEVAFETIELIHQGFKRVQT